MFSTFAHAQEAATTAAGPSLLENLFPFAIMFIIFFLFILRPQQRRAEEQKKFLENLKRGDSVLTSGGIMGTIEGLTERFVTLQIANGVKIKVLRTAISGQWNDTAEVNQ